LVVVVLPDPFQGMGAWRNSTETQQSGHAPRPGPEVKNGRNSAKDGAPERLRCGTIQEEVSSAPTSRRLNVVVRPSPPYEMWAEMARQLSRRFDHPVAPNRQQTLR